MVQIIILSQRKVPMLDVDEAISIVKKNTKLEPNLK